MLKLLFGGTFGYVQAALVGVAVLALVWLWQDYQGAKEKVIELKTANAELQSTIESKDGVIASMGRSAGRRSQQDTESKDLGDDILQAKDGNACALSEPIRVVFDGLRLDPRTGKPVDASNKAFPVLAGAYPADTE